MQLSMVVGVLLSSFPLPYSNVFFYLANPGYFSYKAVVFKVLTGQLNSLKGGQNEVFAVYKTSHRGTTGWQGPGLQGWRRGIRKSRAGGLEQGGLCGWVGVLRHWGWFAVRPPDGAGSCSMWPLGLCPLTTGIGKYSCPGSLQKAGL